MRTARRSMMPRSSRSSAKTPTRLLRRVKRGSPPIPKGFADCARFSCDGRSLRPGGNGAYASPVRDSVTAMNRPQLLACLIAILVLACAALAFVLVLPQFLPAAGVRLTVINGYGSGVYVTGERIAITAREPRP